MNLDRIIQIQRATTTDDGFGTVETFTAHGHPIRAGKADLSDAERFRAGAVDAIRMARFTVRYSTFTAALTPADRLICEGVTYNITGIKEAAGRRQWLEISATSAA